MPETIEIPVKSLPSKGIGYNFNILRIPKLVYTKIIDYQAELEKCNNELSTLLCQLKHVVMPLEHGKDLSMYDAIPVLAIRSYTSTCEKLTNYIKIRYTCPIHRVKETMEVKLNNLNFNDINPELYTIKSIKINGNSYEFRIPTVEEFIDVANSYKTSIPVSGALKLIWTLSMFKGIQDKKIASRIFFDITNATTKDIVTLDYLYKEITNSFTSFNATCKNGGEPVVVKIPTISPITDVFQNILQTEELDKTSIEYREINES